MAQTSLASQLERLEAPQTSHFKSKKGRVSFLYDYLEAASFDCSTHYSNAISGLGALVQFDATLSKYEKTLFDETSRTFERGIRTAEENESLDHDIERFLYHGVSPYFMHGAAHKVLEWLVYKYHVNEYTPDELIVCLMPYHETRFFAKLLQTVRDFNKKSNKWHFLRQVQKAGIPLPKTLILNHCISEPWLLKMIASSVPKSCEATSNCNTTVTFATSIMLGVLQSTNDPNIFLIVSEYILEGLKSNYLPFVLSAYAITAYFASKFNLEQNFLSQFFKTSSRRFQKYPFKESCTEEYLALIAIICKSQEDVKLPKGVVDIVLRNEELLAQWPSEELESCILEHVCENLNQEGSLTRLGQILKRTSYISKVTKKKLSEHLLSPSIWSQEDEDLKSQVLIITLNLCHGHSDIRRALVKHDMSGQFACRVIERLTIMIEEESVTLHRIPFYLTSDKWRQTVLLLEIFRDKKMFDQSTDLMNTCFALLKESFVTEEESGSEYWRMLLLGCIANCLKQKDIELKHLDVQSVIENIRHSRKPEAQQLSLQLLQSVRDLKKDEILQHAVLNFGYVGSNFIRSDDEFSMKIMDQILEIMLPTTLECQGSQKADPIIDVFIDAFLDIPSHRRLQLFTRLLSPPRETCAPIVVSRIFLRTVSADSINRFVYSDFAAELTSALSEPTQKEVIKRILSLSEGLKGEKPVAPVPETLKAREAKVLKLAIKKFLACFASPSPPLEGH